MTRAEIREFARLLVGETAEDGFTDGEFDTHINHAQIRVAIDTLTNTTNTDITIVSHALAFSDPTDPRKDGRYGMPDDLLAVTDLELYEGTMKTWPAKKSLKELIRMFSVDHGGKPRYYATEFGATEQTAPTRGDIWFKPLPDADYIAKVFYVQRPSAMNDDTDISELPTFTHEAIAFKTAERLSFKFKDRELLTQMAALYRDSVASIISLVHQEDMVETLQVRNVYRRRRPF